MFFIEWVVDSKEWVGKARYVRSFFLPTIHYYLVRVLKVCLGGIVRVEWVSGVLNIVTLFVSVRCCNSSSQLFRMFSGSQRRRSPLLGLIGSQDLSYAALRRVCPAAASAFSLAINIRPSVCKLRPRIASCR